MRPEHFPLDAIAADLDAWRKEVQDGKGLLLLRGFPVDEHPLDEREPNAQQVIQHANRNEVGRCAYRRRHATARTAIRRHQHECRAIGLGQLAF